MLSVTLIVVGSILIWQGSNWKLGAGVGIVALALLIAYP